ncbi:hypothetical protein VUN82_23420 [Micrococcaceae bacterium Sec5.1]
MSLFTVLATSKVAAGVLAAGAVAAGGTGVAAFNGALPTEIQQSAHDLVGAPAPLATKAADAAEAGQAKATDAVKTVQAKATDAAKAGEDKATDAVDAAKSKAEDTLATTPEAFGLCTAFIHGGLKTDTKVPGFQSIVVAAGGEANVESHCQAVVDAGKAAGLKADGSANANANADASVASKVPAVPAVPAVPGTDGAPAVPATPAVPAAPAAPALPTQVPTDVPAAPGAGLDSVR